MNTTGKVAVVTGASRGIGHDVAVVLAEAGMRVVVAARTMAEGDFHIPGSLEATVADVAAVGGQALPVRGDVAVEADRVALVRTAQDAFGRIDLLVNNAGIAPPGRIEDMKPRHFELAWRINVEAPFSLARLVLPIFRAQDGGTIINISSGASRGPGAGPYTTAIQGGTVYGLTKAALERFTQGLAAELAGSPISVTALSPATMIYVGGTVFVTSTDPAFSVSDLAGRRKDGRIMGDACLAIAESDPHLSSGHLYTDESALTELKGVFDFSPYATY